MVYPQRFRHCGDGAARGFLLARGSYIYERPLDIGELAAALDDFGGLIGHAPSLLV
jgi:hypothetical protein